jgi:hypothetical protein
MWQQTFKIENILVAFVVLAFGIVASIVALIVEKANCKLQT